MDIKDKMDRDQRKQEVARSSELFEKINKVVTRLADSCNGKDSFDHVGPTPIPSKEVIKEIIRKVRAILFPGYFSEVRLDPGNVKYYLGQKTTELYDVLAEQIVLSIQHDCFRYDQPCTPCRERGLDMAVDFLATLPDIRELLAKDIEAAMDGDPSTTSFDEIIFSYPGVFAIMVYRMAHKLVELGVPLMPRIMTEHAHSKTGIDIHPGAEIGESFFIDHGTGVVVGETTKIGNRVRLYQGVTLGALSLPRNAGRLFVNKKRHPTIEDDVIIYSSATILGGKAVIGARSIIGGNVWITESVPPDTKVLFRTPELEYIGNGDKSSD